MLIKDGFVKDPYTRHANLEEIPLSRRPKDAYGEYSGMMKDLHNAVDGPFTKPSV